MGVFPRILNIISFGAYHKGGGGCCADGMQIEDKGLKKLIIVGTPNVGKSVVFNSLTGARATVSNYPGTTVAVSRGKVTLDGMEFEVVDTPGMYSLMPITEEERIARDMLLNEEPQVILHVVDAKNLERMLPLTLQLIEAGLPAILQLNMMDEAETSGVEIDFKKLEEKLGIPVVPTAAVSGRGMELLRKRIVERARFQHCPN